MITRFSLPELQHLERALALAIEDQREYVRHGNPDADYPDEVDPLRRIHADIGHYAELQVRMQKYLEEGKKEPKFTVVLIYPDYIASQYGEEYFISSARAKDAHEALKLVRHEACSQNEECNEPDDFGLVAVFPGDHLALLA